jgi:hypothetical protein
MRKAGRRPVLLGEAEEQSLLRFAEERKEYQ